MINRMLEQQQPLCATLLELKKGDLMTSVFHNGGLCRDHKKPQVDITEAIENG